MLLILRDAEKFRVYRSYSSRLHYEWDKKFGSKNDMRKYNPQYQFFTQKLYVKTIDK